MKTLIMFLTLIVSASFSLSAHAFETRRVKNVDESSQSLVRADRICGLKPETVSKHHKAVAYEYGSSEPQEAPEGLPNAWYTIGGEQPTEADYVNKKEYTFYDPNEKSIAMVWAENKNKFNPGEKREIVYSNISDLSYRADFTVRGNKDCSERFVWLLDYSQTEPWNDANPMTVKAAAQAGEDFKKKVIQRCDQLNVAEKGASKFEIIVLRSSGMLYQNYQFMAKCLIAD